MNERKGDSNETARVESQTRGSSEAPASSEPARAKKKWEAPVLVSFQLPSPAELVVCTNPKPVTCKDGTCAGSCLECVLLLHGGC